MDKKALTVIVVHLALVSVTGNGRQLCQQVHALDQGLVNIRIVRIIIIIIQGQDRIHKLVHQVLSRQAQQVHFHKLIRDLVAASHHVAELFQFPLFGKIAEQQQETYLLIAEVASLFAVHQVQHIDSSVKQTAGYRLDAFLSLLISHHIGHSGKSYTDTCSVFVSQALLYIVLFIPLIRNICIILGFSIKLSKIAFLDHCYYSSLKLVLRGYPLPSVPCAVIIDQASGFHDLPFLRCHIRNI